MTGRENAVMLALALAAEMREDARRVLREAEADYGRAWAHALEHRSRKDLAAAGYEEPVSQPGRNPQKLRSMAPGHHADQRYPQFSDWLSGGVEGGPDVGGPQ